MRQRRAQAGDTIVEVLIAIGVLSLVLVSAFVVMRSNLSTIRRSQERNEAQALVASQLEKVRALAAQSGSVGIFNAANPGTFCLNASMQQIGAPSSVCTVAADGSPTSQQPAYALSISRSTVNGGFLFKAQAVWDDVGGHGKDNVTMVYKVYKFSE